MDCEKFDRIALDLLYEELDELTVVAAKRHIEQCTRCREIYARFRATREVGVVPLLDPPDGFEQRVLEAERGLRAQLPFAQRFGRAISILAGYSMRPQLAMAALLMLMIGSSLIFLKARPGQRGTVHITERGVPGSEAESLVVPAPKPEPAAPPAPEWREAQERVAPSSPAHAVGEPEKTKLEALRNEVNEATDHERRIAAKASNGAGLAELDRADQADQAESPVAGATAEAKDSDADPAAALGAARDVQQSAGCGAAVPKFDQVAARFPGTSVAYEAIWHAAECRRLLGQVEQARQGYQSLLAVSSYRDRALAALAALSGQAEASGTSAAREAPPAAEPAKPSVEKKAAAAPSAASP